MFSECMLSRYHIYNKMNDSRLPTDASRFLAQSQSRLLPSQTEGDRRRNPLERPQRSSSRASSRGYLQRQPFGNPYQSTGGQGSRFPFGSRLSNAGTQAPLFHSAHDEFREEDDIEEHEREVADLYALQQSRRDVGTSKMTESSESERDVEERADQGEGQHYSRGIRSSWTEDRPSRQDKEATASKDHGKRKGMFDSVRSSIAGRGKGRLVDVNLDSTIHEDEELVEQEPDDDPPPVQHFRSTRHHDEEDPPKGLFMPQETDLESQRLYPRPISPDRETVGDGEIDITPPPPTKHDAFWGQLFLICVAATFATFILVCLHTSSPDKRSLLGDTVYTTITSSYHLLAVDTLVAVVVALIWLAILRSFVRQLVFSILIGVPIVCVSFSLYPFVISFQGTWHGEAIQDRVMRWLSFVPAAFALIWTYTAYKSRHSLGRSIELLEFSSRILAASPSLILIGFATLGTVIVWSWIWMLMFTRVFLEGHFNSGKTRFLIDTSTWWMGIFFVLTYLWTLGVIAAVQRTTTAATVSQWYFHRLVVPTVPSATVVQASLKHSGTTIFGTICYSTLLALAIRLPLLILPRRLAGFLSAAFYSFIPTSIATLTNPLTLTYAAIHSQNLNTAARGLSNMSFISQSCPTTTLTPSTAASPSNHRQPIFAYRLAKLLLHATRFITSLAFGFGGWVSTARMLQVDGAGYRGSLYAYIVGLIAGAIGWAVLGAMEGVLGGVLDGVIVCYGSEMGRGDGTAKYCREAGELLGGNGEVGLG